MAKQLNVDMRFNADTTKAKQAINDLEQALSRLGHATGAKEIGVDPVQFEKASEAARELEFHLKNAFNAKTGNLDLSKLNQSLKISGTNLNKLASTFTSAGSTGQKAFTSLARAIATADQPSLTLNTHLATMVTTLKNVARFQLSSSIMHGLIGGIQSAYGYAQDLNKSLNNIRIVTGQSTDQMARFAEQANKSARALSASTLDYTDAALIYYQQGLGDADVKARTDVTVKMANVSRQSAEEVSSQMTAIWNNFDDGTKSLEYYADVITALGASTASSSSEIAEGLEKFAAVADTIGLSYEYATAALATVVAETRQGADTVGTAFRTIFSRLEGLKLGETLEDGVDLNKYSKALKTVGVDILDATGNLKDMDTILDETAAHWDTLTQAQKVAFAETVGGVRQYTNLISLLDNWDKMQANVKTAEGASGTLQKQADIYAESWEAARDRVKAAAESIYSALLDDSFFIGITNMIEHILAGIKSFIDSFGGIKGLLIPLLSFAFDMIGSKIGPAVSKIVQDIQILSGKAGKVYQNIQKETSAMIDQEANKKTASGQNVYNQQDQASLQGSKALLAAKTQLSAVEDKLSASEKMRVEIAISGIEKQAQAYEELGKKIDNVTEKIRQQAEEEKKKAQQAIEKVENDKQNFKDKLQDERSTRVGEAKQSAITELYTNPNAGFGVNDLSAVREQLTQAESIINDFGNKVHNALIDGIANGSPSIGEILSQQFSEANISDSLNINTENIEIGKAQLEMFQEQFSDIIGISQPVQDALDGAFASKSPEELQKSIEILKKALLGLGAEYEELGETADQVAHMIGISPKELATFKKAKAEADSLKQQLEQLGKITPDTNMNELIQKIIDAKNESGSLDTAFDQLDIPEALREQFTELINLMEQSLEAGQRLNNSVNQIDFSHTMGTAEVFTTMSSGIMQIGTSIQSVRSLINAWNNDDLTFGEKITQSLMSIGMVVPSVLGVLSKIGTIREDMANRAITAAGKEAIASAITVGGLEAEQSVKLKNLVVSKAFAKACEEEAAGQTGAVAALIAKTLGLEGEEGAKVSSAIASTLLAGATDGETAANWKDVASILAKKAAMWEIYAVIAAVALIVGLLVVAIKASSDAYNADAITAEKAAAAAREVGEAYDEARQKADDIKSSFDKYKSAVETLKNCTKGTQEWRDALAAVNNEVLNILQKYPELAGQLEIERDEAGQLVIKNAEEILAQAEATAKNLQMASIYANAESSKADLRADATKVERKYKLNEYDAEGNYLDQNTKFNSARKAVTDDMVEGNLSAYLDETGAALKTETELFNELGATLGMSEEEFSKFYQSISSLAESSLSVATQLDNAARLATDQALAGQYNDLAANGNDKLNNQIKDAIVTATSEKYQDTYDNIYDEVIAESHKNSKGDKIGNLEDDNSIWYRYLKAIGEDKNTTKYKLDSNAVQGTDDNRTYHFNNGDEDTEITEEAMARIIAAYEAMNQMGEEAEELATQFGSMSVEAQTFTAGLINSKDALGNYHPEQVFENFTQGDLNEFLNSNMETGIESLGMTIDQFNALATSMGMNSNELYESLVNTATSTRDGFDKIGTELSKSPQEAFGKLDLTEYTSAQKKKIAEMYKAIYEAGDREAINALDEFMANLDDSIDKEAIADIFSEVDWSDWDVDEQIIAKFEELDIPVPDGFDDFINRMRDANDAIKEVDLDSYRKNFGEIQKITKDIQIGDTISADDYAKLGDGYDEYFQLMADGTYKLIGSAKDFQKAAREAAREDLVEGLTAGKENLDEIRGKQTAATKAMGHYSIDQLDESATNGNGTYNTGKVSAQLDFLKEMGYDSDQLDIWAEEFGEGINSMSSETLEAIGKAVKSLSAEYNNLGLTADELEKKQKELASAYISTATSTEELDAITAELIELGVDEEVVNAARDKQYKILGLSALEAAKSIDEVKAVSDQYGLSTEEVTPKVIELASNLDELKAANNDFDLQVTDPEGYAEKYLSLSNSVFDLRAGLEEGAISVEQYNAKLLELTKEGMNAAKSLNELDVAIAQGLENGAEISYDDYANALVNMASGYDNTFNEINRYQEALERAKQSNDAEAQAALAEAEANLRAATAVGEAAKKYGFSAQQIERYAEELKNTGKYEQATKRELVELAKDQLRYDKAVTSAQKNMSKWTSALEEAAETGHLAGDAADEMAEAYGDLLDIDGSELSASFLSNAENLELMQKALEGDEEAYKKLQDTARQDIALRIGLNDAEFQTGFSNLLNLYYQGQSLEDIEVGASLNDEGFLQGLTDMVNAAGMTAQEATDYLSSMGVDAEVVSEPTTIPETVAYNLTPITDTVSQNYSPPGGSGTATYPRVSYKANPVIVDKTIGATALRVTSAAKSSGGGVKHSGSAPAASGGSSGGGGGGGGGGKSKEAKSPTDEKTRYHTITQQLEDLKNAYDDISKARERAFGQNKSKLLDAETKNIEKQIAAQKKYIAEIRKYLYESEEGRPSDKAAVEALGAEFDVNGVITNYDSLIDELVRKYNEGVEKFNAGGLDEDAFKEQYEEPFNKAKEAIDQYVESINLLQEEEYALGDMQDDLADKLREQIEYKVELHVELNEDDLKVIDYQLKHLGDDAADAMEKLELLGKKINITMDNINTYQKGINDLLSQHLNEAEMQDFYDGKLTTEDLKDKGFTEEDVNTLRDYRDKLLEANEALIEMREEMEGQFLATLDHYNEKIDKTQERFDQITKMAEHYKNIVDIVGKDKLGFDDEALEALDTTMVESANAKLESETKQLEELKKVQAEVEETLASGDFGDHDKEFWEKQLEEVTDRVHTQEEQWAQAFEDSVTAVRQKLENAIERATQKAKELAGLTDSVLKLKDFISSVDDITVSDSDKMYQLTKLNREIEASMSGTNNNRSKKELLELQKKINNAMRDGQKYSQQDLDLLQKEFELKKAQLALEETQNTKTTVRMSRDNEGNWGYVYTADEDQLDQAQQELDDKIYEYNKAIEETIEHFADLGAEITQQYWELRNEILLDSTMTVEEQQRQLELLDAKYAEAMSEMTRETDFYTQQSAVLYEKQYVARAVALDIIKEADAEEVLSRANALQLLNEGEEDNVALARERMAQLTGDREVYYETIKKLGDEELIERATQLGLYSAQEAEELLKSEDGITKLQTAIMDHYDETERQTLDQHATTLGLISEADRKGLEGQDTSTGELRKKILDHYQDIARDTGTYNEGIEGEISRHVDAVGGLQLTLQGNEDKVAQAFQATPQAQATGLGTMEEQISTYLTTSEGLVTASEKAMVDANEETKEAFEAAGTSVEDFHEDVDEFAQAMTGSGGEIDETKKAAEQVAEDMSKATEGVTDFLKKWQEQYSDRVKKIMDSNTLLAQSVGDLLDKLAEVDDIPEDYGGSGGDDEGTGGGSDRTPTEPGTGEGPGGGSEGGSDGDFSGGDYVESTTGWITSPQKHWKIQKWHYGSTKKIDEGNHVGDGNSYYENVGSWEYEYQTCKDCGYTMLINKKQGLIDRTSMLSGVYTGTWSAVSGRTGMYTGSWNGPDIEPNGRLAFLHQKELVLNADDTQNMLTAVKYVREIANMIDLSAGMRSRGIGEITPWISDMPKEERIEQEVHIEASFPSVVSHSEIEEAFKNIIGKASQFAYRK